MWRHAFRRARAAPIHEGADGRIKNRSRTAAIDRSINANKPRLNCMGQIKQNRTERSQNNTMWRVGNFRRRALTSSRRVGCTTSQAVVRNRRFQTVLNSYDRVLGSTGGH